MDKLHVITPVKDSIELTKQTIKSVVESELNIPYNYTVYNDFSTSENTLLLEKASKSMGFRLINLSDLTNHPSPNYLLVLQHAQQEALAEKADLLIVERDVVVKKDTLQKLNEATKLPQCGIAASVTVDEQGIVNYPYQHFHDIGDQVIRTKKHCSFCCSLLTYDFLRTYSFKELDPSKNWYDVTISHEALKHGFHNYIFGNLPVWHRPHSSRPWKQLKYSNPLKYYWIKFTKGYDKI